MSQISITIMIHILCRQGVSEGNRHTSQLKNQNYEIISYKHRSGMD